MNLCCKKCISSCLMGIFCFQSLQLVVSSVVDKASMTQQLLLLWQKRKHGVERLSGIGCKTSRLLLESESQVLLFLLLQGVKRRPSQLAGISLSLGSFLSACLKSWLQQLHTVSILWSRHLLESGFHVTAIRPPTVPTNSCRFVAVPS